CLQGYSAPYGF
nr:immunoglobulin light chain junction region [Macaca mulatta]